MKQVQKQVQEPTTDITRSNIDALLDAKEIYVLMNSGNWWAIKRNGKTQRWKRDASRIRVPFKTGLYQYGAITESDFLPSGVLDPTRYRVKE
jgi:hypothetical protein